MMLGQRLPAFNFERANALVPNLLSGYGSPARGVLVAAPNARGIAKVRVLESCRRCGGGGGSDKWALTGWTCFDCSGKGAGAERVVNAYTADAYAKLNARREKLAAKRAAAEKLAEDARRAPFLAWLSEHEHLVAEIRAHTDDVYRSPIEADLRASRIPQEWRLHRAIADVVRRFVREDLRAASKHIGEVGKRLDVELTCEKLLDYSERYSNGYVARYFYVALMRDQNWNRVVYKGGNPPLGEGDSGRFRVSIKEHGERDGEKQTIVQRPKALDVAAEAI